VALQKEQRGLGDAVLCGREHLEAAPFLLALGDCLMSPLGQSTITRRMQELFAREQPAGVIALQRVPRSRVNRYGIAAPAPGREQAGEFPLQDLIEKPDPAEAPSEWAVAGRYILNHRVFDYLENLAPGRHNEIQLTDALRHMIRDGAQFWGVTLAPGEERIDVGNYQIYSQACLEYSLRNDPELRAHAQKLLKDCS
jgi:UTP--glucose-1-phosphate uridylyltransferase